MLLLHVFATGAGAQSSLPPPAVADGGPPCSASCSASRDFSPVSAATRASCLSPPSIADPRGKEVSRALDACRLNQQCQAITAQSSSLCDAARRLVAQGGVAPGRPQQYKSYSDLLLAYHEALAAYLQHRAAVKQHAAQFHQQAQMQKVIDSPIELTAYVPLKIAVEDQCGLLQLQEKKLTLMEYQLRDAVEALVAEQGRLTAAAFQSRIAAVRALALADEQASDRFEAGVQDKSTAATSQLHDKIHQAYDCGDYVFCRKSIGRVRTGAKS